MMTFVNKLLIGLAFILSLFGLHQRNRADRNEAKAKDQAQRADSAESTATTQRRVSRVRSALKRKQKQEQRDAQARLDDGRRDHFDNNG